MENMIEGVVAIIEQQLPILAKKKTLSDFGDRKTTIGASDVVQCILKVIMSKLYPQTSTIEQEIVFERGHLAENIVRECLVAYCAGKDGMKVDAQVEVCYEGNPNIKAHIDFVLSGIGVKTVIEVKTATMVSEPYDSWVQQCLFQQGLLKQDNPEIEVNGYVLCIDLKSGKLKEFEIKYDENVYQDLIKKAEYMLAILSEKEIDFAAIPLKQSILCGYCAFQADCPAYAEKANVPDDLKELIRKYSKINFEKKKLDKEIDTLKELITSYGPFRTTVDGIKASYTVSTYNSLDIKALKENEPELAEMYSSPKEVARLTIS